MIKSSCKRRTTRGVVCLLGDGGTPLSFWGAPHPVLGAQSPVLFMGIHGPVWVPPSPVQTWTGGSSQTGPDQKDLDRTRKFLLDKMRDRTSDMTMDTTREYPRCGQTNWKYYLSVLLHKRVVKMLNCVVCVFKRTTARIKCGKQDVGCLSLNGSFFMSSNPYWIAIQKVMHLWITA